MKSPTQAETRVTILDLPDLLQGLCDARRSGTLVLQGVGVRAPRSFLYLRAGALAAAWDGDLEVLGKALVKTRALEWARLRELLDFFRPAPAALERLLREQQVVGEAQLREARAFIVREVLTDALTWSDVRPEFHEGPPLPELLRVDLLRDDFELPTRPCLMQAAYQRDEWARFREVVPSDGDVVRLTPGARPPTGVAAEVVGLVDGERDVGTVIAQARLGRAEAAAHLRGLIERGEARPLNGEELLELARHLRRPGAVAPPWLVRLLARAEELGALDEDARVWLGEEHEARGDRDEASRQFVAIGRQLARVPERRDESTRLLRRALDLRPDDGALHRELVESLLAQGRLEDAAVQAEGYVDWLRARRDAGTVLRATRDLLEQLESFEEILILRAELTEAAGDPVAALHLFRRVAEGRLEGELAAEFSLEEKTTALRRVVALDPQDRRSRLRLAKLLADTDGAAALAELDHVLIGAREARVAPADRIAACELMRRLAPSRPITAWLADAWLDAGVHDTAAQALRASLDAGGAPEPGLVASAERLVAAVDRLEHRDLLARALVSAGEARRAVGVLEGIAVAAIAAGDRPRALAALRSATRVDPFVRTARLALDVALESEGAPAERLENLRALVAIARVERDPGLAARCLADVCALAPDDRVAALELLQTRLERGGGEAADGLKAFLEECARTKDEGLAAWARERARALGVSGT